MGNYSRQARTIARFWRRLLTGEESASFDNGEKSSEQVEMQVRAEIAHDKGSSNIDPETANQFEQLLAERTEAELESRGWVSVGLKYRPEADQILGGVMAELGLPMTLTILPWDTWTRVESGRVIKDDSGREEELPLLDAE